MSDVNINIRLVTAAAEANARRLQKALSGVDSQVKKTTNSTNGLKTSLGSVATIARGVFLGNILQRGLFAIASEIRDTIFAFGKFEDALIGVGKIAQISGKELSFLGDEIENLSRDIPVASTELLKIAETASRLGVRGTANIKKFTEVIARLSASTDLKGSSAALTLARLQKITGESAESADKLGSVIVELGRNFAVGEAEISRVALDLARGTAEFGFASKDLLALATALKETGTQSEISGSQIGLLLKTVSRAADDGGPKLSKFADVLGVTDNELKDLIKNDAPKFLFKLVESFSALQKRGGSVDKVLRSVGLTNIRISKVIPPLAKNFESLARAQEQANIQAEEGTALNEVSNTQFESQVSQLKLLGNQYVEFKKEVSKSFAPAVNSIISKLRTVAAVATIVAEDLGKVFNPPVDNITGLTEIQTKNLELQTDTVARLNEEYKKSTQAFLEQDALNNHSLVINGKLTDVELNLAKIAATRRREAKEELDIQTKNLERLRVELGLQKAVTETKNNKKETTANNTKKNLEDEQAVIDEFNARRDDEQVRIDGERAAAKEAVAANNIEILQKQLFDEALLREEDKLNTLEGEASKIALLEKLRKDANKRAGVLYKQEKSSNDKKNSDKLKQERKFQSQLGELGKAGATGAFAIQKALSIRKAYLAASDAAISAEAFGSGIGGPVLGKLFKVLSYASTAAEISNIASAKAPTFQNGGIVGGNNFSGDRVNARVNSGEMILNRSQQSQLFQQANGLGTSNQSQPQEIMVNNVVELDGDVVFKSVSRKVADGHKLGEDI